MPELDPRAMAAADYTLGGLRPFPVAVTTIVDGRRNGLMSLSAGSAGIIREAPRVTVSLLGSPALSSGPRSSDLRPPL